MDLARMNLIRGGSSKKEKDLISAQVMMMMLRTFSIVLLEGKDTIIGRPVEAEVISGVPPPVIILMHPQNIEMELMGKLMKILLLIIAHSQI